MLFLKNKLIIFLVFLSFLVIGTNASASTTNGTIDSVFHYAWGENVGWVDFANIQITDSALSGSVYGENVGWIDLSTILNTSEGILSGYAWGENIGWVDFSAVTIGIDGIFAGSAYGENVGWITFGTGENKVLTDWRPESARPSSSSGSRPKIQTEQKTISSSTSTVVCKMGEKFSTVTGLPCTSYYPPTTTPSCFLTLLLKYGSRGDQVKCLQTDLNLSVSESLKLSLDGIFGPKTKAEVIAFQKLHNLVPDGIVGPITRGVINNLIK